MSSKSRTRGFQRNALAAALSILLFGSAIAAETGGLRVSIVDKSGNPVAGATVNISSPSSLVSRTAVTDADGSARLQGLDPATNYTVVVAATGFEKITASDVAVVSGKNLSLGYSLGMSTLEAVLVTGASLAAVDTTSPIVSTTLTLDVVESLPTGRNYQSYLQLVPGVEAEFQRQPVFEVRRQLLGHRWRLRYLDRQSVLPRRRGRDRSLRPAPSAPTSTPKSSRNSRCSPVVCRRSMPVARA